MDRASPLKGVSKVRIPWISGKMGGLSESSFEEEAASFSFKIRKSVSDATKPLRRFVRTVSR